MIKLNNIKKYYNYKKSNQLNVIDDMSLELPSNGIVALFGRSGCGKTTLLNLIGGLDEFQSGDILIDNQKLDKTNQERIRNSKIGYIFQNYNLDLNKTVGENVEVSLKIMGVEDKNIIDQRVDIALESVGMQKFKKRLPSTLSGGQQQRVAIARALVKSPDIILADEPTGNLDEANTIIVMNILRKLAQTKLVLLVTHEEDLVDNYCDRIIHMADGNIVQDIHNDNIGQGQIQDKRTIYLGDMPKHEYQKNNISIEFYGEDSQDTTLKIINKDGKIYIQSNSPAVKFVDSTSEIKISNNKFNNQTAVTLEPTKIQQLEPIQYKKGKLNTFKQSFMQGIDANFKNSRFMRKSLVGVITIFSFIIILLASAMGVGLFQSPVNNYGVEKNVITVSIENQEQLTKALEVLDNNSNVKSYDLERISNYSWSDNYKNKSQNKNFSLQLYSDNVFPASINWNGVFVSSNDMIGKIKYGREVQKDDEIIISTKTANNIMKSGSTPHIKYEQQFLSMNIKSSEYGNFKIVGIADEYTNFCYIQPIVFANKYMDNTFYNFISESQAKTDILGIDQNFSVQSGDMIIASTNFGSNEYGTNYTVGNKSFDIKGLLGIPYNQNSRRYEYFIINDNDFAQLYKTYILDGWSIVNIKVNCNDWNDVKIKLSNQGLETMDYKQDLDNNGRAMSKSELLSIFITFMIILTIMTICIAFIMRASLMPRVKEIGVLRAIGATKKDIIHNFLIETFAVICWTILLGAVTACVIVWTLTTKFVGLMSVVYLPVWFALVLVIGMGGICMLCGILPLVNIIRLTPAQILAKYDV